MTDKPETPADPRDGEPYYIDSECPQCGTELEQFEEDSDWNDEWECPQCQDGIHMDWPEEQMEHLKELAQDATETGPLEVDDDE